MALAYWNIVMKGRFKFLDLWCNFLQVITHTLYIITVINLLVINLFVINLFVLYIGAPQEVDT